jgi:class 3 adenylate cyclase
MGLHTGAADLRDGDYYGSVLNRAARLMSVAHGVRW